MAEGNIEFILSVYVCVCVCVFQIRVRPITSLCMVEFEKYLAQMIITIGQCVVYKNHVARSKVKITDGTLSLCILKSCPTHYVIMNCRI